MAARDRNCADHGASALADGLLVWAGVRLGLWFLLLSGCWLDRGTAPEEPVAESHVFEMTELVEPIDRIDYLFVIDDSPAMAPYADTLRLNLANFMRATYASDEGVRRYQFGVITGDLGGPGCSDGDGALLRRAQHGRFIVDGNAYDGSPIRNYDGSLEDAFTRLGDVGAAGCAKQQPFEAVRRALDDPRNAGFRRAHAKLGVIFISASEDMSPSTVDVFATQLQALASDRWPIAISAVLAPCGGPSPRWSALLSRFANRSTFTTMCQQDWEEAVFLFSGFGFPPSSPCVEPLLDTDPLTAGVQPDCVVVDAEQSIPSCALSASLPCWRIEEDERCSLVPYALVVDRGAADPPDDDEVQVQCVAAN